MKTSLMFLLACLLPLGVFATSVPVKPLADLVKDSDHVVVAAVVKVDMIDGAGKEIKDRDAMTGPGLDNQIRLHLEIREVLFSSAPRPPKQVMVRLWQAWHFTLGGMQDDVMGNTSVFLLKGNDFNPVYPAGFERPLPEREEIEKLLGAKSRKH